MLRQICAGGQGYRAASCSPFRAFGRSQMARRIRIRFPRTLVIHGLLLHFATALFGPGPLASEELRLAGWHFYKKIQVPKRAVVPSDGKRIGVVGLDSDVIRESNLDDLRIVHYKKDAPRRKVETWPYLIRKKELISSGQIQIKPEVLHTKGGKSWRSVLYQLPELESGYRYYQLDFFVPHGFEGGVSVSTGASPDRLEYQGYYNLYSYRKNLRKASLRLPIPRSHRYLRIKSHDSRRLRLFRLRASQSKKNEEYHLTKEEAAYTIEEDEDAKESRIYIKNPNRRAISRLELYFADEAFDRRLDAYYFNKKRKRWTSLSSMRVLRKKTKDAGKDSKKQVIAFFSPVSSPLKLVVYNDSDDPLHLESLEAFAEELELVVELPKTIPRNADLRLYYGNEYIRKPSYEFRRLYDSSLEENMENIVRLSLSKQVKNPDFAYSLVEPPLSVWILRFLIVAGILLSSFPAWKLYSRIGRKAS